MNVQCYNLLSFGTLSTGYFLKMISEERKINAVSTVVNDFVHKILVI